MVKLNNFAPQSTGFNQTNTPFPSNPSPTQSQFSEPNQQAQSTPPQKGLISVPPALMQIVPWIPFALEAMSGQKIPAIGGTIGEIQSSLQQIQFSLQQLLANQQQFWTKLESLENNASHQLTNLSQQVASTNKSFHLLATETKRSLEFNPRPKAEPERNYEEPANY